MKNIITQYNFLNDDEIEYLNELSKNFIIHRSDIYNQTRVNYSKLESYQNKVNKFISDNFEDKYVVKSLELNRITEHDVNMNGFHNDHSDLTFISYFNNNFEGGEFEYIDNDNNHIFIKPEINMTLIMDKNPLHRVNKVTRGERFSLATFLIVGDERTNGIIINRKKLKSMI